MEPSNLNRQHYFPAHVGRPKVEALAEQLLALTPDLCVDARMLWLNRDNIPALLPEADRAKLDEAFGKSAQELLSAGIEVGYSKEVKTGFKVGAKEGGYYISFSDADFDALLGEYLREKVSDMLFKA